MNIFKPSDIVLASQGLLRHFGIKTKPTTVQTIKDQIIRDMHDAHILNGMVTVPQYDREKGVVEIKAQCFSGSGSYLLTDHGVFIREMGETTPIDNRYELNQAYQMLAIVTQSDPELASKIDLRAETIDPDSRSGPGIWIDPLLLELVK